MSSSELQDEVTSKPEDNKNETSISLDSNANTSTNIEPSSNSATEGSIESNLDLGAGGDWKTSLVPPAIITDASTIIDNVKSDVIDNEGNLCKENVTGGVDNDPVTPGPKIEICNSPDFNLLHKTINFLSLPQSITGRSTPATDSSEMMEEDMVLKWDDDDEETEKVELKDEECKSVEVNLNPNIEDLERKESTAIEKSVDAESSAFENKELVADTDKPARTECMQLGTREPDKFIETPFADSVNLHQENKEDKNTSIDNITTNVEHSVKEKDKVDPIVETKTVQKQDVTEIGSVTKNPFANVVDEKNDKIVDNTEIQDDKLIPTSIDNIISSLDEIIDNKVAEDESISNENKTDEDIALKWDDNDDNTEKVEANVDGGKSAVGDKNISVANMTTNLEQIVKEKGKVDSTIDTKTDQKEINVTELVKVESITEKPFVNTASVENKEAEMDVDNITTSVDNIITSLDQIIEDKVAEDIPTNKENEDSALATKTDQKQINLTGSAKFEMCSENAFADTVNKETEEDTEMDVDTVNTSIDNIITNLDQMIDDEEAEVKVANDKLINKDNGGTLLDTNVDKEQAVNMMDTDTSDATASDLLITKSMEKSIDLNIPSEEKETLRPVNKEEIHSLVEPSISYAQDSNVGDVMKEESATIIFPAKSISTTVDPSEVDLSASDSFLDATLEEREHNLNKPNMMIEIPSQNMMEFDDSINVSSNESTEFKSQEDNVEYTNKPSNIVDKDTQKEEKDITAETITKLETLKVDSEINVSEKQDLNEVIEKCTAQETVKKKTELSVQNKEHGLDTVETEATKHIDPDHPVTEVASIDKDDLPMEKQDDSKPVADSIESAQTVIEDQTSPIEKPQTEDISQNDTPAIPDESKATSSQMAPDTSDEVPEVTDSLGLLAESSRVMEDDEEQETSDHDEGDDEEDFDPDDESSNQMTAEHSEDSNPQQSETDTPKDKPLTQADIQTELDIEPDNAQDFIEKIGDADDVMDDKDDVMDDRDDVMDDKDDVIDDKDDDGQLESNVEGEIADKEGEIDIEEDMVIDEVDIAPDVVEEDAEVLEDQTLETLETTTVVESAQVTEKMETAEEPKQVTSDIETVKLSDTSDAEEDTKKESDIIQKKTPEPSKGRSLNEIDSCPTSNKNVLSKKNDAKIIFVPATPGAEGESTEENSILKKLLVSKVTSEKSPAKTKKLEISKPKPALSFVDLEESSSEDEPPADVQEVPKAQPDGDDVTSVNIPNEIEIMSVGGTSDIVTKEKEVVISGVPKPPPGKVARLNTSEVTIKTTTANEPTPSLVIPEVKGDKTKYGLEVFNLDSDEEDVTPAKAPTPQPEPAPPSPEVVNIDRKVNKCINSLCTSDSTVPRLPAPRSAVAMYAPHHNNTRRPVVCETCAAAVVDRSRNLVADIRNLTPLLQLDMGHHRQELVEISDSDSEGEGEGGDEDKPRIGEEGASMLDQLTEMINASWRDFNMDARLKAAETVLQLDLDFQEKELKELGSILDECQVATDKLRNDLYATFEPEKHELPALVVFDTPDNMYSFVMPPNEAEAPQKTTSGQNKRRLPPVADVPSKRTTIPLGFTPLDEVKVDTAAEPKTAPSAPMAAAVPDDKADDDKDISVVQLSAESAPASLPPPGEPARPRVHVGMQVYAMRNAFGSWLRAKIVECSPKGSAPAATQFSQCKVKFESKSHKNAYKLLSARCLAYTEPSEVRMTIGTRIIALFKDSQQQYKQSYHSGIVAEVPNPVNNFRYLVFFDVGYAQYLQHADTRLVCEFSALVWEEVHPFSREFVRQYLLAYPERPMVRLHTGQSLKTEWNGKWWTCKVLEVDASLVHVYFETDKRTEWIYRGSTRLAPLYLELQAAERHRARPLPRNRLANQTNMPYVEYTRSDEQQSPEKLAQTAHTQIEAQEELRRQRSVAKKSTVPTVPATIPAAPAPTAPAAPAAPADTVTSRVVYYTPKNAVKPYKMTTHTCSPKCKRSDVLSLKELRTYNPLAKPLLSGWERQLVRFKGHKEVMYRAPCGRRLRDIQELHRYLRTTKSEMPVDLFDFAPTTHCLAEFVLNKCIVGKKDLSNGKENVPVPCVNYYDDSLPEFCSYNTERTPTEGVPLNLDPDFLCGCDCTDDCQDKSKCACWKLTLEGARTIGLDGDVGYVYRRLPEPLPSGIYECNSKCKCKQTCLNRVAQHPLQLKLQVFKTSNRGWGIRALNDVPKGAFLCVYAGNLLTDATANLDGLNEGDEYLAELDYIEVVEQMKEGYEEDIPPGDKRLDKKESGQPTSSEEESSEEEEEQRKSRSDLQDGDFEPGYIGLGLQDFSKRLRRRDRNKKKEKEDASTEKRKEDRNGEDCITISDDEELRAPARLAAQPGMGTEFVSKYRSVRSYFGKDEACYIMDAKVQGNIGRYLNHSCSPNVFVQNVFVDTHDPRFPWVAFFALRPVRAGTELTWNYNYDVGSVPGKVLYCHCGAANCRGRLL